MRQKLLGTLVILFAATAWGCMGIFTRSMYVLGFAPFEITFIRAAVTVTFLFLYLLFFKREALKITVRDIPVYLGSGIASYLFFNYCYMSSIRLNSLSVAALLMYTSPIWVTVMAAIFFKEKITVHKAIALLMAVAGCALVSLQGSASVSGQGLIYGLLSGIGYALYSIFGRIGVKRNPPVTVTFYTFLFAVLGGIPLLFVMPDCALFTHLTGTSAWLWAVSAGLIATLIPYVLYTTGLKLVSVSSASIISILEPVVATLVGLFFYSETLSLGGVFGIVIIITGLVLLERSN